MTVALSVSTSIRPSPRSKASPGDFSQRRMTASAIESESFGIVSSPGTPSVLELRRGELGRERRGEAALAHPVELGAQLALDLVEIGRADAFRLELRAEDDDGIARAPLVELALGSVGAWVAARVADEA